MSDELVPRETADVVPSGDGRVPIVQLVADVASKIDGQTLAGAGLSKRIVAQVDLVKSKASTAPTALGVFQAATFVTGQYYLHAITERSGELQRSIDSLTAYLEIDAEAELDPIAVTLEELERVLASIGRFEAHDWDRLNAAESGVTKQYFHSLRACHRIADHWNEVPDQRGGGEERETFRREAEHLFTDRARKIDGLLRDLLALHGPTAEDISPLFAFHRKPARGIETHRERLVPIAQEIGSIPGLLTDLAASKLAILDRKGETAVPPLQQAAHPE